MPVPQKILIVDERFDLRNWFREFQEGQVFNLLFLRIIAGMSERARKASRHPADVPIQFLLPGMGECEVTKPPAAGPTPAIITEPSGNLRATGTDALKNPILQPFKQRVMEIMEKGRQSESIWGEESDWLLPPHRPKKPG